MVGNGCPDTYGMTVLITGGAGYIGSHAILAFGEAGYTVLLVSALVATVTCINGGLYGMTSITFALAEKGQLPSRLGREVRASTRGLTFSAAAALVMINTMDLTTVASLGSATTLVIYFLVNLGAFRLIRDNALSRFVILLSVLACLFAVLVWLFYTLKYAPGSLGIFAGFIVLAVVFEVLMQRLKGRRIKAQI